MLRPALPLLLALVLAGVLAVRPAAAQERDGTLPRPSPNAVVTQTVGVTPVTVSYSRPAVRGRTVFGDLVPYGDVWRTGANEATTITIGDDLQVEGQPLPAGTYALFTIPGEDEWTVIFNDQAAQWGAFNRDAARDVLSVTVPAETAPHEERLAFSFDAVGDDEATLALRWAETRVPITLSVDTDAVVAARGEAAAAGSDDWRVPFTYASYLADNAAYRAPVLAWLEQSASLQPTFENHALLARLHAEEGRYADAVTLGEEAVALAEAQERAPRGLDAFRDELAAWRTQR